MAKAIPELNLAFSSKSRAKVAISALDPLASRCCSITILLADHAFARKSAASRSPDGNRQRPPDVRECPRPRVSRSLGRMLDSAPKRSYDLGLPLLDPAGQTCPSERYDLARYLSDGLFHGGFLRRGVSGM